METEFEAKFYPIEKSEFRKRLKDIGAKLIIPERMMRRAIFGREDYPQFECNYVRVRDEGNGVVRLSAKVHAKQGGKVADQKELDVEVNSYDRVIELFFIMGFKKYSYQENLRETWKFQQAEIVIDTWPGLQPYVEIEANSESEVKNIAEQLGLKWKNKIINSISGVFSKVYNIPVDDVLKKIENITFENNIFSGLTRKWKGD